ncbi:MAG: hypothetical protein HY904_13875 [Deltaproteobacteria bacterium]|nr:hypothetical protein [Deltaproteobacteria bacterium]
MRVAVLLGLALATGAAHAAEPRAAFTERAWRVEESSALAALPLPTGWGSAWSIVDAEGGVVGDRNVEGALRDEKVAAAWKAATPASALRWTMVGLSVAALVIPFPAALPGLVLGGLLGAVFGLRSPGTTLDNAADRAAPVALGAAAGAVMGASTGAVLGLLVCAAVGQVVGAFVKPSSGDGVRAAVRAHNADLAAELGLDPDTLPPEYFPAGR